MNQLATEGRKLVLVILSFCALLLAAGCEKAPLKPAKIGPNDPCFNCKLPIVVGGENSQEAFAAEFITKDGFVRKFDSIECLVANAKKIGTKDIQAFYAVDIASKTWMPADQLVFVKSDKINIPVKGGMIAFKDAAKAQDAARQSQGELVKFSDLIK